MMSRAAAPPRGPRGTTPMIRGRGGSGGIQKPRGGGRGPARDKDGDLVMDAASDKGRSGRGRGGISKNAAPAGRSVGGLLAQKQKERKQGDAIARGLKSDQANVVESKLSARAGCLQVDGLSQSSAVSNPDGGVKAMLSFLERKATSRAGRQVKITKHYQKGGSVFIFASQDDLTELEKNNNYVFAAATLTIKPRESSTPKGGKLISKTGTDKVSKEAQDLMDRFRTVLATRYDPETRLLNLSALAQDPGLQAMDTFNGERDPGKVFMALMRVCDKLFETRQAKREAIASVSLSDNGLEDIQKVASLAETFPDLKNIDLSRNNISHMKALDAWRYKFKYLENLLLAGNPIEAGLSQLKDEFMQRYHRLQVLNEVQVRTPGDIAALDAAFEASKAPIPIASPDFRDVSQVGENFIRQFFSLYDNNREGLLSTYYDSQTSHSLSVNMTAPKSNDRPISAWAPYTKLSRNLTKLTHLPARTSRSWRGVDAIKDVWASLPLTRHPDLQTQSDKYIIECKPLPGLSDPAGQNSHGVDGLIITTHGEFEEDSQDPKVPEKAFRSFSRSFVLAPGPPGGLPIRVVSDVVVLRAYGPLAQPQTPGNSTVQQGATEPAPNQQEAMARQLTEKTGMTLEYSVLCLKEMGWDIEMAYNAFIANKANLPPNAFIGGATA